MDEAGDHSHCKEVDIALSFDEVRHTLATGDTHACCNSIPIQAAKPSFAQGVGLSQRFGALQCPSRKYKQFLKPPYWFRPNTALGTDFNTVTGMHEMVRVAKGACQQG